MEITFFPHAKDISIAQYAFMACVFGVLLRSAALYSDVPISGGAQTLEPLEASLGPDHGAHTRHQTEEYPCS